MHNGLRFLEMIKLASRPPSAVHFHFLKTTPLRSRKRLKTFLGDLVFKETGLGSDLSFVFCSDLYLLEMNQRFLKHDFFTDILTFPLDSPDLVLAGEMYLSVDRIRDNATQRKLPLNIELHRVVFHGVLHLCGYKDKSRQDKAKMSLKEDLYLEDYFQKKVSRGT